MVLNREMARKFTVSSLFGEIVNQFERISWVTLTSILLLNFVIATPLGYPLTVAPFFVLWFLWKHFYPTNLGNRNLALMLGLLILPLANLIQVPNDQTKLIEFLKTYSLWCFSATSVIVAMRSSVRRVTCSVENAAKLILVVITALLSLQVTFVYVFSDSTFFTILGGHLYGGYPQLIRFIGSGAVRPLGFYFEPSFCALVMIAMMAILFIGNKLWL